MMKVDKQGFYHWYDESQDVSLLGESKIEATMFLESHPRACIDEFRDNYQY